MEYHKLVRDKIPAIIEKNGGKYVARVAGEEEFLAKLRDKLKEEVEEFLASSKSEEIADIYEVLDALMKAMKADKNEVLAIQKQKRQDRGGFEEKIILESSEDKK
ncbi:MAG: hypothetical protein A2855_02260 [Candidatus Liptonbacteria bacterium RIFCSPHIGHO2_01_FULL_57_28]|uniref:Phosphoribosyl-ATP pyrophosphohydrolase n=1 Tax=Candidatus Liptonbacteria bacterium RIFCSPHIGHO2_01_FULL_57_28 TaxID=1798647 RepID=A0A1G2C904_9BACT|nr:MAG: hypothetical protein A2855_02260 [Candidatus Liptonbacteria bacterium RIFCSPHIGHO2_01_FULL_57_28]